jgi:hypothetical protein
MHHVLKMRYIFLLPKYVKWLLGVLFLCAFASANAGRLNIKGALRFRVTYFAAKCNNKMSIHFQNHARAHRSHNAHTICDCSYVSGRAKVAVLVCSVCCTVCAAVEFSVTSSVCVP